MLLDPLDTPIRPGEPVYRMPPVSERDQVAKELADQAARSMRKSARVAKVRRASPVGTRRQPEHVANMRAAPQQLRTTSQAAEAIQRDSPYGRPTTPAARLQVLGVDVWVGGTSGGPVAQRGTASSCVGGCNEMRTEPLARRGQAAAVADAAGGRRGRRAPGDVQQDAARLFEPRDARAGAAPVHRRHAGGGDPAARAIRARWRPRAIAGAGTHTKQADQSDRQPAQLVKLRHPPFTLVRAVARTPTAPCR